MGTVNLVRKVSAMITIRCRLLQTLEFLIILSVFWVISVFLYWQVRGPCETPLTSTGSQTIGQTVSGNSLKGPVSKRTPVYIVEEHHEVLLYWFDAAEKGFIKRQGNVLFHIDAHSDGSPPDRQDILPIFRWPSQRDIYNMMQRNDAFVVGAAYTGLINRYIWVRPPWDLDEEEKTSLHAVLSVKLGTVHTTQPNGTVLQELCMCDGEYYQGISEDQFPFLDDICSKMNLSATDDRSSLIPVERSECKTGGDNALIEIVSEDVAIVLLKTGKWITSLDSVILDVDEDYYGVEAAVLPLYDVNITESNLSWIQYFINGFFCPIKPRQEREADNFYAQLLDMITNMKQLCIHEEKSLENCKNSKFISDVIYKSFDIFTIIEDRSLKSVMCKSEMATKWSVRGLVKFLLSFNPEQLNALKEVGICFRNSPRTLTFDASLGMRPCDGYNRPNESVVVFHTPTNDEVTFRTSQLKVMLSSEGLHPGIVTVCRSVRDGYTPRDLFHRIEEDVLGILKDSFKTIDENSFIYDSHLLGGASGWYKRH